MINTFKNNGLEKSRHSFQQEGNLTPKQLHDKAQEFEQVGDNLQAASYYEQAGYTHKAIKIYQNTGDVQKAYDLAKKTGDNWTADKLAYENQISSHEYSNFPNTGKGALEGMKVALKSRLQKNATVERLGFHGFEGKVVADIGSRDGRFIQMFQDLGAKEVYGIDPEKDELKKAVQAGVLDAEHAIPLMLQDIPDDLRQKFEVATIFNFNMPHTEYDSFFRATYDVLPENGEMVMTVAEDEILKQAKLVMQKYFIVHTTRLWGDNSDFPHKNLVVCTKKPKILVEKE